MNKQAFLNSLRRQLNGLPESDINEILFDYEEHFRLGVEDGKTEEQIAKSLGDVRAIARQFKADFTVERAKNNSTFSNVFKAVLATAALGFLNLVFVLGPFMGLVGVLIGMFGVSIGMVVGGLGGIFAVILYPMFPSFISMDVSIPFAIFFCAGIAATGLLSFIGNCYVAKYFFKGTIKYLKWNIDIIANKEAKPV